MIKVFKALMLGIFLFILGCNPCKTIERKLNRNSQCVEVIGQENTIDTFIVSEFEFDTLLLHQNTIDTFIIENEIFVTKLVVRKDTIFLNTIVKNRVLTKKRQVKKLALRQTNKYKDFKTLIALIILLCIIFLVYKIVIQVRQ